MEIFYHIKVLEIRKLQQYPSLLNKDVVLLFKQRAVQPPLPSLKILLQPQRPPQDLQVKFHHHLFAQTMSLQLPLHRFTNICDLRYL